MNVKFNSVKKFIPTMLLAGSVMSATLPLSASAKSNNNTDTFERQKTELIQQENSKALTDSARTAELDSIRKHIDNLKQTKEYAKEKFKLAIEEYKTQTGNDNVYITTDTENWNENMFYTIFGFLLGAGVATCIALGINHTKKEKYAGIGSSRDD